MQESWCDETGSIDQDADHCTLRRRKASIHGMCGRRRCIVDSDQTEVASQSIDDCGIERWRRAVVDDDDFVRVGIDLMLVIGRQREQRARRFPRYVENDDDHRQCQHRRDCTRSAHSYGFRIGMSPASPHCTAFESREAGSSTSRGTTRRSTGARLPDRSSGRHRNPRAPARRRSAPIGRLQTR